MPSEHTRRKDDTWTSEELNKALKGSKHEMLRKKRGTDEGAQRHRSDDVNHKRVPDGASRHREEDDKKTRRHKDRGDSIDRDTLTEEERERLRQERRARREGGKEEKKTRPKESKSEKLISDDQNGARKTRHRDGDEDRHREKTHHRGEEPQKNTSGNGERRRFKEEGELMHSSRRHREDSNKPRHREDSNKPRHREDSKSRHHEDSKSRHPEDSKSRHHEDSKSRHQKTEKEARLNPRNSAVDDDDDEEERDRRQRERREMREREKNKDREKDKDRDRGSRVRNEKPERDLAGSRDRREVNLDEDKDRDKGHKDKDRVKGDKDRDKEKRDKDRDRVKSHKTRDRDRDLDQESGKPSSRRSTDEEKAERRISRHHEVYAESEENQSKRYYEESAQASSSPIGQPKSKSPAPASNSDADNDDYEEDFEDYDDDFEDDDGGAPTQEVGEVGSVLRALSEENKLAASSQRLSRSELPKSSEDNLRVDEQRTQEPARPKKSFINFVSAKQRVLNQAMSGTAHKRFDDLSRLIELDVVKFDMFDLQPVKEYDMYIRSFGRSDTKQAYVQTRDDDIDKDIQTEEADVLSKWTQQPPSEEMAVGGEGINVQGSDPGPLGSSKSDAVKLSQFLDRASRIMFTILDEESKSCIEDDKQQKSRPAVSFCNSSAQLGKPNFLIGRQVIAMSFCQLESGYLLSVHSTPDQDAERARSPLENVSITCVWKLSQPAYPYRICGSQMMVTCACFSPTKASLVFAGMSDGSVSLWDLREPSSDHRNIKVDGVDHLVRFPTYNTARVMEPENHHSPVVAIVPVYSSIVGSQSSEKIAESSSGLSFQLASVEEKAVVNLWVAAEVTVSDAAGSETDLGLSPGGKLKLLRSSSIILSNPDRYQSLTLELKAVNLHLDPHDLNHFYVGTDNGFILHGVCFGKRTYPYSHCPVAGSPVPVVSVDFSPFGQAYFLAGCQDGTLHLYHTKLENPIATWQGFISGKTILSVRWSHSRATMFFVLDDSSAIFTFDLIKNSLGPVKTDKIATARVTSMEVGGDPNLLNSEGSRPAYMVLALSNGTIEALTISDKMRKRKSLEEEFLATYVDRY